MTPSESPWLAMAWTQLWQVTVVIAVVAILTRLVASRRPQLAFALWIVVFVKCVTPPLWSSFAGPFSWLQSSGIDTAPMTSILTVERPSSVAVPVCDRYVTIKNITPIAHVLPTERVRDTNLMHNSRGLTAGETAASEKSRDSRSFRAMLVHGYHDKQLSTVGDTNRPTIATAERVAAADSHLKPHWLALLAGVWLTGVLAVLGVIACRTVRLVRFLGRADRADDSGCREIVADLARRLKLRRAVRLIVTNGHVGPAVVGLLRPTVLLPRAVIGGKSPRQLELILAHELVHVRRGDLGFGLFRLLVETVWWFHPLVWWAGRRAAREAERCCDEAVLAELRCPPAQYARCLLDVLETKHQLRSVPAYPGVRAVDVTQNRLERIMKIGSRGYGRTPWWCWMIAMLVAAAVLPGAADSAAKDKDTQEASAEAKATDAAVPTNPRPEPLPAKEGTKDAAPTITFPGPLPPVAGPMPVTPSVSPNAAAMPLRRSEPTLAPSRYRPADAPASVEPLPAAPRSVDEYLRSDRRTFEAQSASTRSHEKSRQALDGQFERSSQVFGDQDLISAYVVDDIVSAIGREQGLSWPQSFVALKRLLKGQVQGSGVDIQGPYGGSPSVGVPGRDLTPIDIIPMPNPPARRDTLLIDTTPEGHRRIADALAALRAFGAGQIRLDARLVYGPTKDIEKAAPNWILLPSDPATAASRDDGFASLAALSREGDDRPRARSQVRVERAPPLRYQILDESAANAALERWQADKQVRLIMAPTMQCYNGQSMFVRDMAQSPFVTGLADGRPQTRVVSQGVTVQLRPIAGKDGKLMLDFVASLSKIRNVESAQLDGPSGKMTIQVPEVETAQVEGRLEVRSKEWLLLGGLERRDDDKTEALVVMLRAERVEEKRSSPTPAKTDAVAPTLAPPR